MWHHGQSNPKDILIARSVLFALEHAGIRVFPNFQTAWHFDDKVAQKYLFEALDIPAVPAQVFVDHKQALSWIARSGFPKVFKLRRGAGSSGVRLVKNPREARRLIKKAFRSGFPVYDPWGSLKERVYKWRIGKFSIAEVLKGIIRFVWHPEFSLVLGRERGYVYFQEFVPDNDTDIRIFVVGDRACAVTRHTRPNDFRASGSGLLDYDPSRIDRRVLEAGFEVSRKIGGDALAMDFVVKTNGDPFLIEVSYGSPVEFYDQCPGYWDQHLQWHSGPVNTQAWMVDFLLHEIDHP